jgi:hypothetical protein
MLVSSSCIGLLLTFMTNLSDLLFVGGMCIIVLVLMAGSLLAIFTATDHLKAMESTLFLQSLLAITLLIMLLIALFLYGAMVNFEIAQHK